jgi:hypothetical protein
MSESVAKKGGREVTLAFLLILAGVLMALTGAVSMAADKSPRDGALDIALLTVGCLMSAYGGFRLGRGSAS